MVTPDSIAKKKLLTVLLEQLLKKIPKASVLWISRRTRVKNRAWERDKYKYKVRYASGEEEPNQISIIIFTTINRWRKTTMYLKDYFRSMPPTEQSAKWDSMIGIPDAALCYKVFRINNKETLCEVFIQQRHCFFCIIRYSTAV